MCELLGMCFSSPVAAEFSLSAFALRDEENADGWGLAWYTGRSLTIVKEPLSWRASDCARFLGGYGDLASHLYIAHVRHATVGGAPKHADTHPFSRELGGRSYCFAHNGTVRAAMQDFPARRFQPIGQTDSEHVFCALLDEIAEIGDALAEPPQWHWLAQRFDAINRLGKFNCLLSDGDRLFAWHDRNGFKGLHFHAVRVGEGRVQHLEDTTMEMELESDASVRGIVIATRPLSDSGWHSFQPGELLVVERGRIRHSSLRSTGSRATAAHATVAASGHAHPRT